MKIKNWNQWTNLNKKYQIKEKTSVECLNAHKDYPIDYAIFDQSDALFVKSDVDP